MILSWTGRVVNLFGEAVVIVNSYGTIIYCYKCDGKTQVCYRENYFGMLNGDVQMEYFEAVDISGLPEIKMRIYYIVSRETAFAARQMGRPVDDLLVPIKPLYQKKSQQKDTQKTEQKESGQKNVQSKGKPIGYQTLMPALFLFDPPQARRRYETPQECNAQLD